jgi:ABC-type microcin C transport system duplicated ATPase subunit YejF
LPEALRLHRKLSRKQAWQATIEAMREVAIPDPADVLTTTRINFQAECGNA